jgi:nitrous oxidase accessory protein NosD
VEVEVAKGGGAALAIKLAQSVRIINSTFAHNTAHGDNLDAGAALLRTVTSAVVSGCNFVNNTAGLRVSQQLQLCGVMLAAVLTCLQGRAVASALHATG